MPPVVPSRSAWVRWGEHHVVIVGGGFGGLHAARALRRAPVRITLLDRRNHHLFQPLLYQVATGGLSPANIAAPLRKILARQENCRVLLAEVRDLDPSGRRVITPDGEFTYDTLILATGVRHNYFGHDDWEALAPGLKTLEDATEIRRRILLSFEQAERESDPRRQAAHLTFVVVGAGPTGVELAGALAEIARDTLPSDFRAIDTQQARIVLVDAAPRVLPTYPARLSAAAQQALEHLGVTVRTGMAVAALTPGQVTLRRTVGDDPGAGEVLPAETVLWAAGVQASPLGRILHERTGVELDRAGRVRVGPDLTIAGHPQILVIGDLAVCDGPDGKPLPGVAPVAIQQGTHAARLIQARLRRETAPAFRYRSFGNMATIGRAAAVAHLGRVQFAGYLAWLAWLFVHLINLVEYQNRLLVLVQWAWNYFTFNRAARLITGEPADSTMRSANRSAAGPPSSS